MQFFGGGAVVGGGMATMILEPSTGRLSLKENMSSSSVVEVLDDPVDQPGTLPDTLSDTFILEKKDEQEEEDDEEDDECMEVLEDLDESSAAVPVAALAPAPVSDGAVSKYHKWNLTRLRQRAEALGHPTTDKMKKADLISLIG